MIEILGIPLALLPDRRGLTALLDEELYTAWRERHKSVRDELFTRASLGGIFLLQQMGFRKGLKYDANNRPYVEGSRVDFSISHTDRIVVCALEAPDAESDKAEPCRVGIDAEGLLRLSSVRICPLADRWFSEGEAELFWRDSGDEAFLRIWTKKEALVKWTGEGLSSMRSADTLTAGERFGVSFCEYRVEDTVISLCHRKGTTPPKEVRMLTHADLLRIR